MIKNSYWISLWTLGFTALSACSGGNDNPGSIESASKNAPKTKSAQEVLAQLSPQQQASFERWKTSTRKSCSPTEPFGLKEVPGTEVQGYDLSLISARNGRSLVVSDEATGEFAVLRATAPRNSFNLQLSREGLNVTAVRKEMTCTLSLFGTVVYEGAIVPDLAVSAYFNPLRELQPLSGQSQPLVVDLDSGTAEVQPGPWSDALAQAFSADPRLTALLSRKLNLPEQAAQQIFFQGDGLRSDTPNGAHFAFRVSSIPEAVWSGTGDLGLIAPLRILTPIFNGTPQSLELELRMAPPKVEDSTTVANPTDDVPLRFKVRLSLDPADGQPGQPGMTNFSVVSVEPMARVAATEKDVLACVRSRASALRSLRKPPENAVRIQPQELFGPCVGLAPQLVPVDGTPAMQQLAIPFALAGIHPSPSASYFGWDQLAMSMMLDAIREHQDIQKLLDPEKKTEVVSETVSILARLQAAITEPADRAVEEDLYRMGIRWGFKGAVVTTARISEIMAALRKTAIPFPEATVSMLQQLGESPDAQGELLKFAAGLNDEYFSALSRAAEAARASGQQSWERQMYPLVLQKRFSLENLNDMATNWAELNEAIRKEPALNTLKPELAALLSGSTPAGAISRADAAKLLRALSMTAELFPESSRTLLYALQSSSVSAKEPLEFALQMTPEYRELAARIIRTTQELGLAPYTYYYFNDVLQRRPKLEELTSRMAVLQAGIEFTARERERLGVKPGALDPAQDARGSLMQRALNEQWVPSDFTAMEQLAAMARQVQGCAKPDVATSVQCSGSPLFSKYTGQFLDAKYQGRYPVLAVEFSAMLNSLTPPGKYLGARNLLTRAFLGRNPNPQQTLTPVWSTCSKEEAGARLALVKSSVQTLTQSQSSAEIRRAESDIRTFLKECHSLPTEGSGL